MGGCLLWLTTPVPFAESQRHYEQVSEIDRLFAEAGPGVKALHQRARDLAEVLHAMKAKGIAKFRRRP